jgi:hypothetical protein
MPDAFAPQHAGDSGHLTAAAPDSALSIAMRLACYYMLVNLVNLCEAAPERQ